MEKKFNKLDEVFEKANMTRYSRNELRIETDCVIGLKEIETELKETEHSCKHYRKINSVIVVHIPTSINACVVGPHSQMNLLNMALEKLYEKVEQAYKVPEKELNKKIEDYDPKEIDQIVDDWHNGRTGVGKTLRETLEFSEEEYNKWVNN